eukprot:884626-Rhodomonas_salina.2
MPARVSVRMRQALAAAEQFFLAAAKHNERRGLGKERLFCIQIQLPTGHEHMTLPCTALPEYLALANRWADHVTYF